MNQAIIIDASQNRIYSLDFVSINTSISSTTIVPQKENDEGKSLESTNAPLPVSIPTPVLYNQLLYLNISSNYLFSLFGIQCCPQLKVDYHFL